ncbi:MAG: Gfo/Idh/MocA family oxidoreductase [Marinilabiliales bacterium]|nr:Gfo/Idh/MocA family oxidoreductase [Marinilabiliales bacterium]
MKEMIQRRKFIGRSAAVLAAAPLMVSPVAAQTKGKPIAGRKRLALVGTGDRGTSMWGKSVLDEYSDYVEYVALCDINLKRAEAAAKLLGLSVKCYPAGDFDAMIKETRPDVVIVTTTDCFHEKYIVRAMELGCDVISEKSIATEAAQCQRIADTEAATGRKVNVGFNVRHMAESIEMKKLLMSGELGKVISIDYHEHLDTSHGASYFRRWHGKKAYSGTLLLHKASHHFDLINWLLDAEPVEVQAVGKLAFYGHNSPFRGRTCRDCRHTAQCSFYWDITKSPRMMALYVDCEQVDGYHRDGCVFDNEIDIYDTSSVQVEYNNGTQLTYTMHTFLPYEGQKISFSCELGRLDVNINYSQPWNVEATYEFRLTKDRSTTRYWTLKPGEGSHGGADPHLRELMFKPGAKDEFNSRADSRAGILSSLIGIAARQSIETGLKVKIADLVKFPRVWRG